MKSKLGDLLIYFTLFFSCDSNSIPRFVPDSLTDGATLGKSMAGQGRPHGNIIGPHGTRLVDEKGLFFKTSQ